MACLDGTTRFWAFAGPTLPGLPPLAGPVRGLDWSSDGRYLALHGERQATLVEVASGKVVWQSSSGARAARFSPDSQWLALHRTQTLELVRVPSGEAGPTVRLPRWEGGAGLAWSVNGDLVACDGGHGEVLVLETRRLELVRRLGGVGNLVGSLAWSADGQQLAWGEHEQMVDSKPDRLVKGFHLTAWSTAPPEATGVWHRAVTEREGRRLVPLDNYTALSVREAEREVSRLRPTGGRWVNAASFTPGGEVVLSSHVAVELVGKQPLVLHDGMIDSVVPSPDGRLLATGSLDQTVCISALDRRAGITPLLRLFAGTDGEWVLWTDAGYYACSPNGERLIGWQINRGPTETPDYYPAYQFRKQFYRPDIIARVLEAGSVEGAIALADQGRRTATDTTAQVANLARLAPPRVTITEPAEGRLVTSAELTVRAQVEDPNRRAITKVTVFRNGRAQVAEARAGVVAAPLTLTPGQNVISVTAVNDAGSESVPVGVVVTYEPPAAQAGQPPSLYVLAVGVSQYQQGDLSLKYAAKDARDFAAALSSQQGRLYAKVEAKVLVDGGATKAEILDGLDWLSRQATARDTAVVFVAGHGLADTQNNYFFLPSDGDPEKLLRTGVRWTELQEVLKQLPAKVIAAVDTCHSGGVLGARGLRPQLALSDALRGLGATEVGVVTFASCQPNELSLEREAWANGAFTRALVEGVTGQADRNGDGAVVLGELEGYVLERVKELTEGKQHPSMQRAPTISADTVVVKVR